mmetsp:Transcript_167610/g.538282  ORF Transcript_167610/g.538282 Transcript_167610/m.538282 type:complete len:419 (-) Transcript_167610:197-1453(-)
MMRHFVGKTLPGTLQSLGLRLHEGGRTLAHPLALTGLALLVVGSLGIASYIGSCVPPFVQFCALVMLIGASLLQQYFCITDELFGMCLGTILVKLVRGYKSMMGHYMLLLAIPDLSPADIRIVLRGMFAPETDDDDKDVAPIFEVVSNGVTTNGHGHLAHAAAAPAAAAERSLVRRDGDGFVAATQWLRRPQLNIGLREQLQLHSLFMQAKRGCKFQAAAPSRTTSQKRLEDAKLTAERTCAALAPPAARAQLVRRLVKVDPLFVAAHPELGVPPQAGLVGIVLGLVERRFPLRSSELLASGHRHLLRLSVALTAGAALQALSLRLRRRSPRHVLRWALLALFGSASTTYLLALARGVPAEVHFAVAKLLARLRGRQFSISCGGAAANTPHRVLQYLALLLVPRMNRSLFADEGVGSH